MILVDFVAELSPTLFKELVRAVEFRQHREARETPREPIGPGAGEWATLAEVERAHVLEILRIHKGNRSETARVLGVGERTLYRMLSRYGMGKKFDGQADDAGLPQGGTDAGSVDPCALPEAPHVV